MRGRNPVASAVTESRRRVSVAPFQVQLNRRFTNGPGG
jgi:hypothetical protein